jgi:hypothetical protein
LLFINIYLLSFLVRAIGCGWKLTGLFYVLFLLLHAVISISFSPQSLNGSIFYVPAWTTLIITGMYLLATKHILRRQMLVAGAIFTMAMLFRTVDRSVCQWVPQGTHFIWHLLNAWLLYMLTRALLQYQADAGIKRRLLNP